MALSTKHRVLSPYTSMLVLKTDRDYERFGIGREALADIFTIEDGRIALLHRTLHVAGDGTKPKTDTDHLGRLGGAHEARREARPVSAGVSNDAGEFKIVRSG